MMGHAAPGILRHRRGAGALAGALVCLVALAVASAALAAATPAKPGTTKGMTSEELTLMRQVREIAVKLKAPCCPELTVAQHDSPTTMTMKKEIREMIVAGKSEAQIVSALVEKYGDVITGKPELELSVWRPWIWGGGILVAVLVLIGMARWMMRHEHGPEVLHVTDDSPEKPEEPGKRAA